MRTEDADAFLRSARAPADTLAEAALLMARIEYPRLESAPYLSRLDEMGREARVHVERAAPGTREAAVAALTGYIYGVLAFSGNRDRYDDPHNSLLNQVIDRRTGIPITLAVVLIEVGARAGVPLQGVNFPGHFLVQPVASSPSASATAGPVLLDPFNAGALLSEADCRALLGAHGDEEPVLAPAMFAVADKRDILIRMLLNIKRAYARQHSYPQARDAVDLLLGIEPTLVSEIRDRALLSYRLGHLAAALHDFERCLQVPPPADDDAARAEHEQMWEQVKGLRKRIAGFN